MLVAEISDIVVAGRPEFFSQGKAPIKYVVITSRSQRTGRRSKINATIHSHRAGKSKMREEFSG